MISIDDGLKYLAASTSRRSILAKLGRGLIGAALMSTAFPTSAAAISCGCTGNTKCGVNCGGRPPNSNFCCSCSPPCFSCGGGSCNNANCLGATCCIGSGFTPGWYWYCCKPSSAASAGTASLLVPPNDLWKCQDCCNGFGDCYTSRDIVGTC